MRTGDTSANDRQKLIRRPPDLLITTPESLYLMLTSSARDTLAGVETVIIDEIHAMAATKRGAHLASRSSGSRRSPNARRSASACRPRSARSRRSPQFLGGYAGARRAAAGRHRRRRHPQGAGDRGRHPGRGHGATRSGRRSSSRPARPSAALTERRSSASGRASTREILDQILAHRSTIIFCNGRRARPSASPPSSTSSTTSSEVDTGDDAAGTSLVEAHHGSLAREQRVVDRGPAEARRAARPSSPRRRSSSASTWARSTSSSRSSRPGRSAAGCSASGGPVTRWASPVAGIDLPQAPRRPARGGDRRPADGRRADRVDPLPAQPARRARPADRRPRRGASTSARSTRSAALVRRCANFAELSDELLDQRARPAGRALPERGVLRAAPAARVGPRRTTRSAPATGRSGWPSRQRRHDPRPRPVRRVPARRHARRRARRGDGLREPPGRDVRARRVARGASRTSRSSGSRSRPAPGQPGKMPFWHGDRPGRPLELGRALGAFVREIRDLDRRAAIERLDRRTTALDRVRGEQRACSTSPSRSRPRASCPTTARSSSSASATRSATGGCASSARSARRSTRRGRWRSSAG